MLSCCLIVRNESRDTLERATTSIRPFVDEICVVDTGSARAIRPREVDRFEVFTGCNDKQGRMIDFAAARNRSWELASGDYCCFIDADDVFEGTHKDVLRNACQPDAFVHAKYAQPNGSAHWLPRLGPRHWPWRYPIHENITPMSQWRRVELEGAVWHHRYLKRHRKDQVERNLRICNFWKDSPEWKDDARFLFLLATAERDAGLTSEALASYGRSFSLFDPANEHRFFIAWEMVGFDKRENADGWAEAMISTRPEWAVGYYVKARLLWREICSEPTRTENRSKAAWVIALIKKGLSLPPADSKIKSYGDESPFEIYKTLSLAQTFVGDIEGAIDTCEKALLLKEEPGFRGNLEVYRKFLAGKPKKVA